MRKFQQEQLLEIVASLHDLHREIENRLEKNEYQTVRTALADCQEAAIQMGEAIELLEGDGTEAVRFLELYCEELYRGSMEIEHISPQKMYKNLEEMMIKVENSIAHITVKKEIVFLPYKASMWDSLESVYLAAKEDESCEAYVVPIPYYDRKADGSLGAVHYEGEEYPSNIEIIPYEEYNLEERKPDTIYIHNPYDNWNTVTCVPERFFASNLKKYTNELVYIPYFVLDEIEPDNQVKIDGMKHFCFLPGVIYADKVIVQSENMRQIYINEYINAAKANGLSGIHTDRKYLEEKILGLGSPKFDKVLNTRKEEIDIPETWLKIMKKPDGSFKKVVLYNTSIGALLQYDEKMLEKMKDVFRIFKEQKEEIALLWRPHPLIQTTIEAMRPKLWEEYSKIVEDYCSQGWGIYDDSADLDRAIVLSDAYYGDQSSVVQLYQKTGKPVMVQCVGVIGIEKKESWPIEVSEIVMAENGSYGVSNNSNMLFHINFDKEEVVFEDFFENENDEYCLYISGQLYGHKIYWIPYSASQIAVYDINRKRMSKYELPLKVKALSYKFGVSILYQNKIFAFGYEKPVVLCLDCETMSMNVIDLTSEIESKVSQTFFKYAYYVKEDKAYLPAQKKNMILEFDLKSHQYKVYHVQTSGNEGYTAIVPCDRGFRLFNWNDEEIIWNPQEGIVKKKQIRLLPESVLYKVYRNVIKDINEIKIPFFDATIYISNGRKEQRLDFNGMIKEKLPPNTSRFLCVKKVLNYVFFELNKCFKWYRLNEETLAVDEILIDLPNTQLMKGLSKRKRIVMKETVTAELHGLLMFIKGKKENE